jgi:hypothetical protein
MGIDLQFMTRGSDVIVNSTDVTHLDDVDGSGCVLWNSSVYVMLASGKEDNYVRSDVSVASRCIYEG